MKENRINRVIDAFIHLPFSAVIVRIPENTSFTVETTEPNRNFRTAKVKGSKIEIPSGATVKVDIPGEEIEIKDWRGRTGHTQGASIKVGEQKVDLNSKNSQVITPTGVELVYENI